MNPPAAVRTETSDRATSRAGLIAAVLVVALMGAIGLTFVVNLSSGPATVPRITFENPTPYALDVEVSPGPGAGWTSAGSVRQLSTADVQEVIDQGEVWIFRFDSQGETGGELRLSRADLAASNWHVVVPTEVGRRLAEAGAPPTP
jgi:hypothetical protein